MLRKFFVALPIVVMAMGGSTACATKKFVSTSVGEVNDKVDSLGKSVEETQERTRQNEGRSPRSIRRPRQAAAQAAAQANQAKARREAANGVATNAKNAAEGVDSKLGHDGQGQPPAGLRSRAERGPGQLQVRQDEAAGRSQAEASTRWSSS